MTMMEARPEQGIIAPAPSKALWHEVDAGFWVGNADGRFLGTIERHGRDRFFARDSVRAYVGEYRSLAAARRAIGVANG